MLRIGATSRAPIAPTADGRASSTADCETAAPCTADQRLPAAAGGAAPAHVAIIMDDNRHRAARCGLPTAAGHAAAKEALRHAVAAAAAACTACLTGVAFSTEICRRDAAEVAAMLAVMQAALRRALPELREGARLAFFSDLVRPPHSFQRLIRECALLLQGCVSIGAIARRFFDVCVFGMFSCCTAAAGAAP